MFQPRNQVPKDAKALGKGIFIDKRNPSAHVIEPASPRPSKPAPSRVVTDVEDVTPVSESQRASSVSVGGLKVGLKGAAKPVHVPAEEGSTRAAVDASAAPSGASTVEGGKGLGSFLKKEKSTAAGDSKPAAELTKKTSGWFAKKSKTPSNLSTEQERSSDKPKADAEVAQSKETTPVKKGFGFFKKAQESKAEEQSPSSKSVGAKKASWTFGKKAEEQAAPKKEEKAEKAKPAKATPGGKRNTISSFLETFKKPSKTSGPVSSYDIVVELDGERKVHWRVTPNGLSEVDASSVKMAASYSARDVRFTSPALTHSQAVNMALAELGEECRIVNETKALNVLYASLLSRVTEAPYAMGPGVLVVDKLVKASDLKPGIDYILGVLLSDDRTGKSLAVLYHSDPNGELSAPQITMNPDDLPFTLTQFASSRRLDPDATEVVLFKNKEFLKVAGSIDAYPKEAVWNGIPVRTIIWTGAMTGSAAAVVLTLSAATAFVQKTSLENKASSLRSQVTRIDQQLQSSIANSVVSFASTQAIDIDQAMERAATLWVPRTRVVLEATPKLERYEMTLALKSGTAANNRPSVLGQLSNEELLPFIALDVPEGCSKNIPNITGGVDALQITITCETAPRSVHRYSPD